MRRSRRIEFVETPDMSDCLTTTMERGASVQTACDDGAQGGRAVRSMELFGHVTVLFVMKDSLYKSLGLDCYDAERNALTYTGSSPVVAHPPCQLWGKMAKINHLRWGGEHNRPGNDGGCFRFALDTVNRCGGVLEHPAETYAWPAHGLPRPTTGWTRWKQGWVCEVWQSAYGHRANKRTWLYCSGTDAPLHPRWERPTGTHQVGFHDQRGKAANKPTLSKREANATPPAFAHYLLELAATCAKWPNQPSSATRRRGALSALKSMELEQRSNAEQSPGSLKRTVRHRSYNEACRDITATPAERETALLAEHVRAVQEIEWLWAVCKIAYWPKDGRYQIEHNPNAEKCSCELIEAEMPHNGAKASGA